jgi:hypothetical protein
LDLVENNSNIVNTLLISIKAHFHVSGLCEKNRTAATGLQNIHMNFTNILCKAKVTVRCAVSSYVITGPFCSENDDGHNLNVNTVWYKVMLETFQCSELHPRQQHLLWFQQDGATAYTAQISMQGQRTMLLRRLISQLGTSPACTLA